MASIPSSIRRGVYATAAVVLAPILFVSLVALAAGDWRQIGATSNGDQISVSSVAAQKNGLRSAWVRVEYKEPAKLPQGGPFVELRARVRFNCGSGSAVPNSVWFYSRDHSGKIVVSKKTRRDDQFGLAMEGNFGEIAKDFVCKQK
jgi:hypothetical protein